MHLHSSLSAAGPAPAMSASAWASPVPQATANALVDALVGASSRPEARAIVDRLLRMQDLACLASPLRPPAERMRQAMTP
ncbi:hypothetical protein D3C78_1345080 [compost metagenome]